jgi:signal transduction histidine kinase
VGRANQLQQVLLNLLTNAMDATPPGGRVRVATRRRGAEVELEVRDTGRGIAEEQRPHIFEPFFSTKAGGRGTGLGLFVSAQIVREHRGRIEVTSTEGQGARIRVVLPAAEHAA